jgi:flagellar hook-basal body complex protein FliE
MNISSVAPISLPQSISVTPPSSTGGTEFRDLLSTAIHQVESARTNATQSVQQFLTGEGEDLHSTVLSVQRADLEFEMMMQIRNKVVGAYQEVMRMQI